MSAGKHGSATALRRHGGRCCTFAPHRPASAALMDFRILGPLEALEGGRPVALGGSKQRALLALLLLHANEVLSIDRLIDELWGEQPPATAAKTLHVQISRLRKALAGADRSSGPVITRERGYELRLDAERLDARRFERLVADGRSELAAGRAQRAATALDEALSLWRGRPLDDLAYEPFAQREIARLEDLREGAIEQLVEAKLGLGRHAEVVGELEQLIEEFPYRERLRGQLMLALYRCDRQAEALQAYHEARRKLVEDVGIEPGERLRELERAILAQDPALALPAARAVEQPAAPEPEPRPAEAEQPARRLVSVVFADIGSSGLAARLDPESMHDLHDDLSEVFGAVIERHGGTIEGFIGDAVVGVFGQAKVHEDDALRAVRAAVELRDAGAELEDDRGVALGIKHGVESGEVFVSAGARRSRFATGEAFNAAARLQRAAADGEILLGDRIHRVVRGAVRAEPLSIDEASVWRLLELDPEGPAIVRSPASPFVNRRLELDGLRAALSRARAQERCEAVTVVGPAGIGKSRLVKELVADVGDGATAVIGRCPSYGEGVTYRPLAEIVGQLGGGDPRQAVGDLLDGDEPVAEMVLAAIGLSDRVAQAEEMFWAVRRMFERAADRRPLVVVVDDVHWAESRLLDLLEYLGAFSSGRAILLVCLARPELLETRPTWATPRPNRSLLVLDPLAEPEARELVENAAAGDLGSETAARIVQTGEGNPLFLEHLVAVGAESGEAALPSSIQAVLAARIDRLEPGERTLLEHASVQGRSFYVGALAALLPERDRAAIATHLVALVNKQLIRAERSEFTGEDAFRFAHVLIREAAYRGLPKQRRAELHEGVARWLEARPGAHDETVGHHLAEAYRFLAELGRVGAAERSLAAAAADRLKAAADAALLRGDAPAGAHMLERAESLLRPDDPVRAELLPRLGAALFEAGRLNDAARVLDEAIARAPGPRLRARAQVERELVRIETETSAVADQAQRVADAVMPILERERDEYGQCRVWLLRGEHAWNAGRVANADSAWRRAAECARRAGGRRELFEVIGWRATAAVFGPAQVDDAIRRCLEFRELVRSSPLATASTLNPLASLNAMKGRFDIAERFLGEATEILKELGGLGSGVSHLEAFVRLLAGRPDLAEARLRADVETLSSMSDASALATTTALLAQAVYAQGRFDEAGELCRATDRRAAADDVISQAIWRGVQAKILARDGRCDDAEALAREAVARVEPTDLLSHRGDAMLDLADVLGMCDRMDASERAARAALALFELKGNEAAAARARSLLDDRAGGE